MHKYKNLTQYIFITLQIFLVASCTHTSLTPPPPKIKNWAEAARLGELPYFKQMASTNNNLDARDSNGVSALMIASRFGQIETVQFLLEKGVPAQQLDKDRQSPLDYALLGNSPVELKKSLVALLIKNNASPFVLNNFHTTPLHFMIQQGLTDQIKEIKFSPPKICETITKTSQESLVELAMDVNNPELAEYLRKQGCP